MQNANCIGGPTVGKVLLETMTSSLLGPFLLNRSTNASGDGLEAPVDQNGIQRRQSNGWRENSGSRIERGGQSFPDHQQIDLVFQKYWANSQLPNYRHGMVLRRIRCIGPASANGSMSASSAPKPRCRPWHRPSWPSEA